MSEPMMTPRQQRIHAEYLRTGSTIKAARRLKISHQAVHQALRRANKATDRAPLSYDEFVNENKDEIVSALKRHKNIKLVARQFGMNPNTLRTHLQARGISTSNGYSDEERAIWEQMYADDKSSYDIARERGVPRSTIDRHLRSKGKIRDKVTATRLALSTDPSKRRGGATKKKPKRKKPRKAKGRKKGGRR